MARFLQENAETYNLFNGELMVEEGQNPTKKKVIH